MLNEIALQIAIPTFAQSLTAWMPFIITGFIVGVAVIAGGIFLRYVKIKMDYDNPDGSPEHGFWHIRVNGDIIMEGWLSTNEILTHEDELDLVAKIANESDVKLNIEEIKKEVGKTVFVYNLKRTDDYDLLEKHGKKTRLLLSNDPLEKENHWYLPVKGKRSIKSLIRTERPRVANLAFRSKKIEVENEDGEKEDWWIGAIEPDKNAGYYEFGFEKEIIPNMKYAYNITVNKGFTELAKSASLFATMFKAILDRENLKDLVNSLKKILEQKEEEIKALNMKLQKVNWALNQKKYVDKGKTVLLGQPLFGVGLIIGAMFFGVIMYEMFPDMFPDLKNGEWIGLGIACVFVWLGVRALTKSKQKESLKYETEDTEVNKF